MEIGDGCKFGMNLTAPSYKVDDRSILLPHYKRLLVEPVLPHLPRRLSPNAITHAGHFLCIAAMLVLYPAPRDWALVASALLLHAYLWCDNADGAHARRTGQASTAGEYLDHGLDLANCAYIGVVSACAIDQHGHTTGLAIATIIPCAAAVTVWEQAVTGVFRLGLLNQIESLIFLTLVMAIDAGFGVDLLARAKVLGFDLQSWIGLFVFSTVAFGIVRSLVRVGAAKKSLVPALGLLAMLGTAWGAHAAGVLPTIAAHALCAVGIVSFGARLLRTRILGQDPGIIATWGCPTAALALLIASRLLSPSYSGVVALILTGAWTALIVVDGATIARRATSPRPGVVESTLDNAE